VRWLSSCAELALFFQANLLNDSRECSPIYLLVAWDDHKSSRARGLPRRRAQTPRKKLGGNPESSLHRAKTGENTRIPALNFPFFLVILFPLCTEISYTTFTGREAVTSS